MRLLLDECIPKRLGREFPEHEVRTVPQAGWPGVFVPSFLVFVPSFRSFAPANWSALAERGMAKARRGNTTAILPNEIVQMGRPTVFCSAFTEVLIQLELQLRWPVVVSK